MESDKTVNITALQAALGSKAGLRNEWAGSLPTSYMADLPSAKKPIAGTGEVPGDAAAISETGSAHEGFIVSDHIDALGEFREYGIVTAGRATPTTVSAPEISLKAIAAGGRPASPAQGTVYKARHYREQRPSGLRKRIVAIATGAALLGGGALAAGLQPEKTGQVISWLTDRTKNLLDSF